MEVPDYRLMFPRLGEDETSYARRLEREGQTELIIRKALRFHFKMKIEAFGLFFEDFELARLRELEALRRLSPTMTTYAFTRRVARSLGVTNERAEYWVARLTVA
jgi:hypothetical protein